MKRGDSGFRPADHVQLATDGQSRVIVSDDVTNNGSDRGPMGLVHQNMCERSGNTPTKYLVDGGFATTADIPRVEPAASEVLAPMTHIDGSIKGCGDPHTPRNGPPRSPLKTCPPQSPDSPRSYKTFTTPAGWVEREWNAVRWCRDAHHPLWADIPTGSGTETPIR